ncbi:MAG: DUF423 domain-containing protein [Methylohalobius sp. ZOD2]
MRKNLFYAAVLAGLAVVMGAFGAHALKASLSGEMLSVWHTAVDYQMWHALGLGLIGCQPSTSPLKNWSARLMLAGIGLFSGSLYLLALTEIQSLGMITPFGGLALIAAWILFALHLWRIPHA